MIRHRRPLIAMVAVVLAATIAVAFAVSAGTRTRHVAGEGPLGTTNGGMSSFSPPGGAGASWSTGFPVCTNTGVPLEIEAVRPVGLVGDGATYLGARIFQLTPEHPDMVFADVGFPPAGTEAAHDADGGIVDRTCSDETRYNQQFLVGLRLGPRGTGGWTGLEIDYRGDGKPYTLVLDRSSFVFCGPDVPIPDCEDAPSVET